MQEISQTKKQLSFAHKQLINRNRIGGNKENSASNSKTTASADVSNEEMARSVRLVEQIGIEKKKLQEECEELRSRVEMLEASAKTSNEHARTVTYGTQRQGNVQSNFDGITISEEQE